ncbi:MAG: hypothetical protein DRP83_07415, partial [Planctomycetota bacterium]
MCRIISPAGFDKQPAGFWTKKIAGKNKKNASYAFYRSADAFLLFHCCSRKPKPTVNIYFRRCLRSSPNAP